MKPLKLEYHVPGDDFTRAGEASSKVKNILKRMGFDSDTIRRVAIAMYEGEINLVIHGGGGDAFVEVYPDRVEIVLVDTALGLQTWRRRWRKDIRRPRTTCGRWDLELAWGCRI